MSLDSSIERTIKLVTLKNALEYDGKAKLEAVISKTMASRPDLRTSIKTIIPEIKRLLDQVNSLAISEQKTLLQEISPTVDPNKQVEKFSGLPELYGAEMGKVVTRFPPEPNGYPHIGHAKAAIIDEEYAKMYNGKLILRFDDTNPLNEKAEYYDAIKDGIQWLGVKPSIIKNTSDDIFILQDYGKKLVTSRGAYVCRCDQKTIQDFRSKGLECSCRNNDNSYEQALAEMFAGSFEPNEATIRFRGDMASLNSAMRDPTLFRIIEGDHPKLGTKVRVYPTYDFAAPLEDSLDGVTHAMRTKEYELRNELYNAILDRLHLRKPVVSEFSRLEFEGLPVSKRKIKPLIENKSLSGWDDPRLPTLVALKRRGFLPEAIRRFVLSLGWTLAEAKPPFESLESFNRKIIDELSMRLFFVRDPIELKIKNANPVSVKLKNHPSSNLGSRSVHVKDTVYIARSDALKLSESSIVRLMELYNVKITQVELADDISRLYADMIGTDLTHDIQKIQWVAYDDKLPYKIITPKKLFSNDQFDSNSLEIASGYSESFVSNLRLHSSVQFVRYGFCRTDNSQQAVFTHR
ncbi:MAG TPA: glutamate--tRNA ligase [Nitrososphaeraceae archaeon]|jgi:glutamyl-tRNA synthetase